MGRPVSPPAPCSRECGRQAKWRGMCRPCYAQDLKTPERRAESQQRRDRWSAVKQTYPSTCLDDQGWLDVFRRDERLFHILLDSIAHTTRLQIDRGRLRLDSTGREIPEGEQ